MNVNFRAGFDWRHVTWGRPDAVRSALCSYCSDVLGEGRIPLILCAPGGAVAQFCDACVRKYLRFDPSMKKRFSVDPKSYDLAEHFLADKPNVTEDERRDLAQHIQDAIEDWLNDHSRP